MMQGIPSFYREVTMEWKKQSSHKFTLSDEIYKGILGNHEPDICNH